MPDHALAQVNDSYIYPETMSAAANRLGIATPLDTETRAALLRQLVDDELLVQRGEALGLTRIDLTVRQAVIDSMIASVTAEADAANPTDDELRNYLAQNTERFSFTSRISIDAWQSDLEPAAQAFIENLRQNTDALPAENVHRLADLPSGLIPMEIAADYVGPGIAAAAASMPDGSSAVFARRGRWMVVRVNARETTAATDLDRIRNRLLVDYRRNLASEMLRDYIDDLEDQADVQIGVP